MAFFAQLLSIWTVLWLTSQVAWKQQLRSHVLKARIAFACSFVVVGMMHLISPEKMVYMIDGLLPYPHFLVLASGVAEIIGGMALLLPRYQRMAAYGIIALLVLIFPANINVAINNLPAPGGLPNEPWYVWSRLAFQPVYILWVWWAALRKEKETLPSHG